MILGGDIGGTKTVLALFQEDGASLRVVREERFPSREHATFDEIVTTFLSRDTKRPELASACFGIAGAVIDGHSHATNLPWTLDERALEQTTGAPRVKLLNDLQAAAFGMLFLEKGQLHVLQQGARPRLRGNVAVIAAGTGLGQAMLYFDGQRHQPIASEGGHADFAPESDEEIELLRYLRPQFEGGHVSFERILSGPGLVNVYRFLRDTGRYSEPAWVAQKLAAGDPSAAISELALAGNDPLCANALRLFVQVYGAEAGSMALRCVAEGGVFIGGGIAPKILAALEAGPFLQCFNDKGRFASFARSLDVTVALEPRAPLLGAAHYARGV
jgi:glucokinase